MSMTFFGTDRDIAQVWRWLFDMPTMRIFEDQSIPDLPNRWFEDWNGIAEVLESRLISIAAWPESASGTPHLEQVIFTPTAQRQLGAKGRTILSTPALIRVLRNNDQNGCVASSSISYWSEKGARQRSTFEQGRLDAVDWPRLRAVTSKVERLVAKASPAKLRSYPVMPDAFAQYERGEIRFWNWGEACAYPSPFVQKKG